MNEEVVKWLTEIRSLQGQLSQLQQQRDEAVVNEANWRKLYSQEAQQRRSEAKLAQQQIEHLQAKIQKLEAGMKLARLDAQEAEAAIAQELAQLNTLEQCKQKLTEVLQERDRALELLQQEQEQHAQTRKSLTAVISDTVDQLTRLKNKT